MNPNETEFWRRLCAPFPAQSYRSRKGSGGKDWTYIPPRVLMNRLDDVLGPANWDTELQDTARGAIITLHLRVPSYDDAGKYLGLKLVSRTGSGAFKSGNGGLDENGVMMGAETTAFRKVCSTFGIGRDLYREGMPMYLADLFGGVASATPQSQATAPQPPAQSYQQSQGGYQQPQQSQQTQQQGVRFDPPFGKPGKNAFAWSKGVSDHFQYDILGVMINLAAQSGLSKYTNDWPPDFVDRAIVAGMIAASKLAHYKGEFDQWMPSQQAQPQQPHNDYAGQVQQNIQNAPPAQQPIQGATDPNGPIRKAIVAQVTSLIHARTGHAPSPEALVAGIGEISAAVLNGQGFRGEVLTSLRSCVDTRWLSNIKAQADKQIAELAHARSMDNQQEDDGLPC